MKAGYFVLPPPCNGGGGPPKAGSEGVCPVFNFVCLHKSFIRQSVPDLDEALTHSSVIFRTVRTIPSRLVLTSRAEMRSTCTPRSAIHASRC